MHLFKHLRRRHFDVAFLIGVAIFGTAFWLSIATLKWKSFYPASPLSTPRKPIILGYSADNQSIYTNFDCMDMAHDWLAPRIQHWNAQTGEMLQDYPLQMPDEDQALLGPPQLANDPCYQLELCRDPQYVLAKHYHTYKPERQLRRLYRIDGKPVGKALDLTQWDQVTYVTEQPPDRHWAVVYELRQNDRPASPVKLVDIESGKTMWSATSKSEERLYNSVLALPGGRYLIFHWRSFTGQHTLEVVDVQTGMGLGRYPLTAGVFHLVEALDETHWAMLTWSKWIADNLNTLSFWIFNPVTRQLEPDTSRILHNTTVSGGTASGTWMSVRQPHLTYVHYVDYSRMNAGPFQPVFNWLKQKGFPFLTRRTDTYRIADLTTGELLREVTLVNSRNHKTDSHFHSIAQEITSPEGKQGLEVYELSSHRWITTLSYLQWLSWLLILPWPLRFLVKKQLT